MNLLGFPIVIHPWSLATYGDSPVSNMSQYTTASIAKISTLFPIPYTHVFSLIFSALFLIYFIYSRNHKVIIPAKVTISLSLLLLLSVQTKSILLPVFLSIFLLLYLRSYFTLTVPWLFLFAIFALSLSVLWFINPILRQIDFYSTNNIFDFYSFPPNMPPLCLFECPSISVPYTEFHIFAKVYQYGLIPTLFIFLTLCFFLLFPFKRLSCFLLSLIPSSSFLHLF